MEIAAPAVLVRKHVPVAGGDHGSGGWNRQREQGSSPYVARLTPIKAGVRDENFYSTEEQGQEGYGDEPVRDANETRVPRTKYFSHQGDCTNGAPVVHGKRDGDAGLYWPALRAPTPRRAGNHILNQEEFHRRVSFQEEPIAFCGFAPTGQGKKQN